MNPIETFLNALYSCAETMTGFFGLTPVQVLYGLGGFLVFSLLLSMFNAIRGKTKFTLDD